VGSQQLAQTQPAKSRVCDGISSFWGQDTGKDLRFRCGEYLIEVILPPQVKFPYRCHPVRRSPPILAAMGWCMDPRPSRRTENRTLLEVPITLVSLDLVTYEVTTTRDVSLHGASVLTKNDWRPNQRIDVRSLQGSFNGFARVVHCQQRRGPTFVMGLEFFFTDGQWKWDHGHFEGAAKS
jgi:PilZ domain-containing protein